jgi:hypothetical protein
MYVLVWFNIHVSTTDPSGECQQARPVFSRDISALCFARLCSQSHRVIYIRTDTKLYLHVSYKQPSEAKVELHDFDAEGSEDPEFPQVDDVLAGTKK